jgi:hypothetical protein
MASHPALWYDRRMTGDEYVTSIKKKYALFSRPLASTSAAKGVAKILQSWAAEYLLEITYSGASAKGTAIRGVADVDLFISLAPQTPGTLADIYSNLLNYRPLNPFSPRTQNVSVGITYDQVKIDLIPARKQAGNTKDHSLYKTKARSWTQTNVAEHINLIQNSQRLQEIRALKIWKALHGLEFPSFYLELATLDALSGKRTVSVAENVWSALDYLATRFPSAVVIDPANSNNRISDDLTAAEKTAIASKAAGCRKAKNWEQILW